jgi:hypothetical protein
VAQLVGSHRIDKAIGAIELVESVGFFAGPVTAGLLLDAFGGPEAGPSAYRPAMVSRNMLGTAVGRTNRAQCW